jgi:hypothetical protein
VMPLRPINLVMSISVSRSSKVLTQLLRASITTHTQKSTKFSQPAVHFQETLKLLYSVRTLKIWVKVWHSVDLSQMIKWSWVMVV